MIDQEREIAKWDAVLKTADRIVERNHKGMWKPENYDPKKLKEIAASRTLSGNLPLQRTA